MGRTTRRTDRKAPAARHPGITVPGALLGVGTLAVSGTGWGLLLAGDPSDDVGATMALGFGAFAGAGLVASAWAYLTRPGGVAARHATLARLQRGDPLRTQGHALAWPPRQLWQLPLLQVLLLVLTVPIAYAVEPGDHSVWGALAFYAVLVAYAGLLASVLVWTMVVMPLCVLGRIAWFVARRRPVPEGDQAVLVLALILLPVVLFSVGIVLGTPNGTKGDQTAAFFGAGEQGSPWLWVARAAAAFLVATLVGAYVHFRRVARGRTAAAPAAPAPAD